MVRIERYSNTTVSIAGMKSIHVISNRKGYLMRDSALESSYVSLLVEELLEIEYSLGNLIRRNQSKSKRRPNKISELQRKFKSSIK